MTAEEAREDLQRCRGHLGDAMRAAVCPLLDADGSPLLVAEAGE